jgi:hypothetical protein
MSEQRDPHADQEWSDQERGLREERLGLASAGAEPRVAQYRLLARVLSEPAEDSLPHNFAALVARRAEAVSEMAGDRVESWVQRVLLAVLALTFIAFFAGDLLAWLQSAFAGGAGGADEPRGSPTARWVLAIGLCIVLSFLVELWTSLAAGHTRLETRAPRG